MEEHSFVDKAGKNYSPLQVQVLYQFKGGTSSRLLLIRPAIQEAAAEPSACIDKTGRFAQFLRNLNLPLGSRKDLRSSGQKRALVDLIDHTGKRCYPCSPAVLNIRLSRAW